MSKVNEGYELIERLQDLKCEIEDKVAEFRDVVSDAKDLGFDVFMANLDAYVFEQLQEHIDNGNPYNQSLNSIIEGFNDEVENLVDEDEDEEYVNGPE